MSIHSTHHSRAKRGERSEYILIHRIENDCATDTASPTAPDPTSDELNKPIPRKVTPAATRIVENQRHPNRRRYNRPATVKSLPSNSNPENAANDEAAPKIRPIIMRAANVFILFHGR